MKPEMHWFCFQRSPSGDPSPAAFDEHPSNTPTMATNIIPSTLRAIPPELRDASLAELVKWAREQ